MDLTFWLGIAKDFGIPAVVLVALALAIRAVAIWFSKEILIPLRDTLLVRALRSFDTLDDSLKSLTANADRMSDNLEVQTASLVRIEHTTAQTHVEVERLNKRLAPNAG